MRPFYGLLQNKEVIVIALDKQIHLYAVDTKAFYTDEEMELDKCISKLRVEKRRLNQAAQALEEYYAGKGTELNIRKKMVKLKCMESIEDHLPEPSEIAEIYEKAREYTPIIAEHKAALVALLEGFSGVRKLRKEFVAERNIVSLFESVLTRTIGAQTSALTKDLLIVKACYFKVLYDIVTNGFDWDDEHYVYFTASAGQIRTKRSVFINAKKLAEYEPVLTCGLTSDRINEMGGINTNKYLAYLALCNSATDTWDGFDITKTIVVHDMETDVPGEVDYIDPSDYSIERRTMSVPIAHTDGCGMVRPDVSKKNFMIRLPWVKGLLMSFPYDKFIREQRRAGNAGCGIVEDIYGVKHDILAEDIQIIFTKSQFKLWNFYKGGWKEYQENFLRLGCEAGVCNVEPDRFDAAKINYQMLQTLKDLSDDELLKISDTTITKLRNMSSDRETMLNVFGATSLDHCKSGFQKCLRLYPELLQDEYTKRTLRDIRKRIEKDARAGKLNIKGIYTFISPDLYAFCQWLFLGDKNPKGLLGDGEVYCNLFKEEKLDCLRAPHLSMEHAVRRNMAVSEEAGEIKRWFKTPAVYTSVHDLISKVLQFDVDGDRSLVVADETIIAAAERNGKDIAPMYYEMKKASAQPITAENIYQSMVRAYTGGNIGQISNDITKIWNTDKEFSYQAIQLLCMENNHVIDYAKTLYKPARPAHIDNLIRQYTRNKVPRFFLYAKGKTDKQVAQPTASCMNRLEGLIPSYRLKFDTRRLGKFDPKLMLSRPLVPNNEISQKIADTYCHMASQFENRTNYHGDADMVSYWPFQKIVDTLLAIHPDYEYVVDVLVKHLFILRQAPNKATFWFCFGDKVFANLRKNLDANTFLCAECGKRIRREGSHHVVCKACAEEREAKRKKANRARWKS